MDHELTVRFRGFLDDLRTGGGSSWKHFSDAVPQVRPQAANQSLNHRRNKTMVAGLVAGWKAGLSSDELRRLRSHSRALVAELLAGNVAIGMIRSGLENNGHDKTVAAYLASVPSVSAHLILCLAATALRWVEYGGLESTPDDRVTNDLNDLDYVLIATFCAGVLSKEAEVNELFGDVTAALDRRWDGLRDRLAPSGP